MSRPFFFLQVRAVFTHSFQVQCQILEITAAHLYSYVFILHGINIKVQIKFLSEGLFFFHPRNLFMSSVLSATLGDFCRLSHSMAALRVIFIPTEECNHGR